MARKSRGRKGRKFRKYLKGQVNHFLSLGTLAAKTLIGENITNTLTEQAWLSSYKGTWSLSELTPATGDGPVMVGIAHSDYSDAEIEAWVENANSWNQADLISQEVARRKIRRVGTFMAGDVAAEPQVLADGRMITTKCGWQVTTGQTVKIWAYNMGSSALATTTPIVNTSGHCNLWPN